MKNDKHVAFYGAKLPTLFRKICNSYQSINQSINHVLFQTEKRP